jgi:hypothetical protein
MKQLSASIAFACLLVLPWSLMGADTPALTWEQQEAFLLKGRIIKTAEAKKGVTGTLRVTLSDGQMTHDAGVQTIDQSKALFLNEVNFKDSYRFYIAAWRLARLLGIGDMVPPSVKRSYQGNQAAFTWWVDDVMMDDAERRSKGLRAPDQDNFNKEAAIVSVFDQLIYNMDRNQTNLLYGSDWRVWMIDHGRAFRTHKTLKDPSVLTQIDRNLLAKLKTLDEPILRKEFDKLGITRDEIRGLLARRDLIVQFFESKGGLALFDRPARP